MVMIDKINFKLLSPKMIQNMSAISIATSDVYDADAYPVEGGVMDTRMGVIDPGIRCKTCGGRSGECQGHFGHIELAKPVYNIIYIKHIKTFLTYTCSDCGAILVDKDKIDYEKGVGKLAVPKTCPSCNEPVEKIKFERPMSFKKGNHVITPEEAREQFEKISDEDVKALGFLGGRPEWMILTILPVPSITTRPSITLTSGERSEDDLTHKLVDIVRINQRLLNNLEIGAPEFILDDLWELLQYHVSTYFNNELSGVPPARHRSGRQLKTLSQRLKSKDGRFRHNLTGKRVNFSARTVVSPDPMIGINEVGVPEAVARELTIPLRCTKDNIDELKACIMRGPDAKDGANYVIRPDGLKKKIIDLNKEYIMNEFSEGYIIEKHISDGDIVLFNRQPSLHKMSLMAHRVKVLPYKTFRLNLTVCTPYNADFDGDEMNLHVPQTAEARAEAEQLMLVEQNIRSPRFGGPIIGGVQDFISGGYLITKKETVVSKELVSQLLFKVGVIVDLKKDSYTGKELLSFILPEGLDVEYQSNLCRKCDRCKKEKCENDAYVKVADGNFLCGVIDQKAISPFKGKILDKIDLDFGHKVAVTFLERVTRLATEYLMYRGFTISVSEEDISDAVKKEIDKFVNEHFMKVYALIDEFNNGKIEVQPGLTAEETLEGLILGELYEAINKSQNLIAKEAKENDALIMAKTGARGSIQNLTFMAGIIGPETVQGHRIFRGYKGRTLPHYKRGDLSSEAHGFVKSCYKKGLSPTEFFFEAMKGREGIMDSSLKTRISGYMQRRLVNALQDIIVSDDHSARDSVGRIIQFVAGEDGVDPAKSDGGKLLNI
ncbi:MAG: DNA-directed RNA polymerase subunit A' [Candidatus Aenigmarchaeota archaeon]|nr:DNA-directed RNA polymerase subunit A' [Candidatus Aenigmarchaeota archaeon]